MQRLTSEICQYKTLYGKISEMCQLSMAQFDFDMADGIVSSVLLSLRNIIVEAIFVNY